MLAMYYLGWLSVLFGACQGTVATQACFLHVRICIALRELHSTMGLAIWLKAPSAVCCTTTKGLFKRSQRCSRVPQPWCYLLLQLQQGEHNYGVDFCTVVLTCCQAC